MDMRNFEASPPIVLNVFDRDDGILDSGDDFLGRAVIPLNEANLVQEGQGDVNTPPTPKWHVVKAGFSKHLPSCGEILCSFAMIADDANYMLKAESVNLGDNIRVGTFNIDINVLGLRQLESFGILPIRKPFIKFNIRSLLPPSRANAVTNIKTDPK